MSADFFFCDIINNPFHYIGELVNKKKKIDEIDDKYFSFFTNFNYTYGSGVVS